MSKQGLKWLLRLKSLNECWDWSRRECASLFDAQQAAFFLAQSTLSFCFHHPSEVPDWHVYSLVGEKPQHSVSSFLCMCAWTRLDKGSCLQALAELKFLRCQQHSCERRAIMQNGRLWKRRPGLLCESTGCSWPEYKICVDTCSEEVKVVLQSQMESERVAVAIGKEICLLTERT